MNPRNPSITDWKGQDMKVSSQLAGFLASDNVPDTLFGYPVVHRREDYTEKDLRFFGEHPEAAGYYDIGTDGETEQDAKGGDADDPGYGFRADGTREGRGWLGELKLPNGKVATEYGMGIEIGGREVEIPLIVPTLTPDEVKLMVNDIMPNQKEVPDSVARKAIDHAIKRMREGKSVWADTPSGYPTNRIVETGDATKGAK